MIEEANAINYIRHLNAFFTIVRKDARIHAIDISLYMALFQLWNQHRFQNPFPIKREEVISLCRIGSLNTYTKCLKALDNLGYIDYSPSTKLRGKSLIAILPPGKIKIDTRPHVEIATGTRRKNDTGAGANMRPINKQINNLNEERENELPPSKKNINSSLKNQQHETGCTFRPPAIREVQDFFRQSGYQESEASKFFYHYQANGWLQGGKTQIINWEAAAHKWILGSNPQKKKDEHGKSKPGSLHVNQNKSYSDPL